jgi:hypothetical protein
MIITPPVPANRHRHRKGQSNISKSLILKGLDNQAQLSKYVCLIIQGVDNQAEEPRGKGRPKDRDEETR